jgi:hypothetical protein
MPVCNTHMVRDTDMLGSMADKGRCWGRQALLKLRLGLLIISSRGRSAKLAVAHWLATKRPMMRNFHRFRLRNKIYMQESLL